MKSPSKILKLCLAQPVSVPRGGAGVIRSAVALDSQHESSRLFLGCCATRSIRNRDAPICGISAIPCEVSTSETLLDQVRKEYEALRSPLAAGLISQEVRKRECDRTGRSEEH